MQKFFMMLAVLPLNPVFAITQTFYCLEYRSEGTVCLEMKTRSKNATAAADLAGGMGALNCRPGPKPAQCRSMQLACSHPSEIPLVRGNHQVENRYFTDKAELIPKLKQECEMLRLVDQNNRSLNEFVRSNKRSRTRTANHTFEEEFRRLLPGRSLKPIKR